MAILITLITGAPGAGKTSALVKLLRDLAQGRAIFVDGIPDLKVPHVELADARKWPELVPDGAAVVIDEVQRVWRPAGAGQKVPEDIALLETHRHRGLDFFIVTQHPKLVHTNVRNLVGRHVHLRDIGVLGRWWYEWPEAVDPGTWRSAPVKKRYRLDKSSFKLYKSASEHIKPIRTLPPALFLLGGALLAVGVLGYFVYGSVSSKLVSPTDLAGRAANPAAGQASAPRAPGQRVQAPVVALTAESLSSSFIPRLADDPRTAPAYDHLRVVSTMPRLVGGYCQGKVCRCFTQQSTAADVSEATCRAFIQRTPFDPYRVETSVAPPARSASSAS